MGGISFAPVPGTGGRYVADSEGNIYGPRGRMKPQTRAGHALRAKPGWGHRSVSLQYPDGERSAAVHRLVFAAFHGPIGDGVVIRHVDGDPAHNWLSNLSEGSPADNIADSIRHGTFAMGERQGHAKLTAQDVAEIRSRHASGRASYRLLAAEYGVTYTNIGQIVRHKSWRSVA
ncbi:HNH endonuclease signature motif containing protein [Streptomyces sp. NBC_01212]|uniref:HNH endonuclease signature motif containing protein n=1 Tax=Streptomyces sp. NBC_01212 TaxID=2903775 RepID=UPI003FA34BD6